MCFFLCAITGYGYRILSIWVNPYKLLVILLFILNIYTYKFIIENKGLNVFHRIYELEKKFGTLKDKIEEIRESIVVDLFNHDESISFIKYDVLNQVEKENLLTATEEVL